MTNRRQRERKRERENTENGGGRNFETSKLVPSDTCPSTRPHLLILPQQFQLFGDEVFRHVSPWGHSNSTTTLTFMDFLSITALSSWKQGLFTVATYII